MLAAFFDKNEILWRQDRFLSGKFVRICKNSTFLLVEFCRELQKKKKRLTFPDISGKIKKIKWKEVDKMRCARWTLVNIYNGGGGVIASLCINCTKRKSA